MRQDSKPLNDFSAMPLERKIAATILSDRFFISWVDINGAIRTLRHGIGPAEMLLMCKVLDMQVTKELTTSEAPHS